MAVSPHTLELTRTATEAAIDKFATSPVAFDVSERLAITEVFLVLSASNERQVGAIVDAIEEKLFTQGEKPVRREGDRENRWVLLDFFDLVVHVMHADERETYSLERLWRDCPQIDLHLAKIEGPAGDS